MKASSFPILIIRDHEGNVLHREYKEIELNPEQVEAICALLARLIENGQRGC